jgi:tetratricopeptide (TPR) repeat protein
MMPKRHLALTALLLAGCAHRAGVTPDVADATDAAGDAELAVPRIVVTPDEALSVDELFVRAERDLAAGDAERAAAGFERVARADADGTLAPEAWLLASEARERTGDLPAAIARLEQLVRRYPDHPRAREALVRLVRLHAYLENWKRVGWAATALLPVVDQLAPIQQTVAYGGKGLSLVFEEDVDRAEYFIEKGRNVVDAYQLDRAGRLPRDLAQLYFALGEIRRARAERIHFVPVPPRFAVVLERRCQLLLDAQSAYSDAMRAYDAHWSTMAGFRVGELYQSLHAELMKVPPPASADTEARRALFEGAMRLRYTVLLEKARAMLDHTLAMAERTGERSHWVERTRASRTEIDHALDRENAVIDSLPFSRADLQAALDGLEQRARERGPDQNSQPVPGG